MSIQDRSGQLRRAVGSRLKLRHLTLLQSLDRHKTVSRVATEMNLTQPAITKALHEIEDIFMTRLFDRTSRGLTATEAGRAVLRLAAVTLADVESTSHALTAIDTGFIDRVRLGITPQVPEGLLHAALTHLLGQSPRVLVLSREGTTDELVSALSTREIDCAIGRSFDHNVGIDIDQEPIYEQEPCLLVSARSRLRLSRGPLDWAKLARLDWIFPPPNTPMRRTFSTIFLSAGVQPPSPVVETMSLRTIETVLRHLPSGVTILAKDMVADLVQRGECAALPYKLTWNLPPVSFFVSRHIASNPTVRSLVTAIRSAANSAGVRVR